MTAGLLSKVDFLRRGDIVDSLRMGWKVPEPREINNVGNCGDEYRRTFFEKPSVYRVRIRLFVGTVEQDLIDFRFRCRPEGRKKQEVLMEEKVYVETQQKKCWLERPEVWKFFL